MAKKLIDVLDNGFKLLVDATASAVGAEPALGDPGAGNWFLKTAAGVRSWVASIPWASVDKTGAVASDVGALDSAPILAGGQLSGFADKANITQSYNEANRTVTISHPSGTIVMYWRGARITKASPWTTAAHSATVNQNYFYYSNDGVNFNWSTTPWEFEDIQVAMIRFGTSLKLPIRECHGLMDPDSHREFHRKIWTYVDSGGALTAGTYAIQVADNASITPGVDACIIRDEDLVTPLNAMAQGAYSVCTPLAGEFKNTASNVPFPYGASIVYYPTDNPAAPTDNKYLNVYRVAVPTMDPASPVSWLWIAPQAQYDSVTLASAESFDSLRLGDLALGTSEYVPFERIIFKFSNSFTNTGKVWIEAVQRLERAPLTTASTGVTGVSGSGTPGEAAYWASPSSVASEPAANFRTRIAALPVANPTATGTLTAPDVVVSNLAGATIRSAALDTTGKVIASSRGFLWSDAAKTFNASVSNLSMLSATSAQRKIAANTWAPGKVLQFKIQSIISSAFAGSATTTFEFIMGPDGSFISPYYTITNIVRTLAAGQWSVSSVVTLRCVTTGVSGSFYYTVDTIISNATGSTMHHDVFSSYTGYTGNTIDTTVDRWIDFTEAGVNADIYGVASSAEWIA